MGFWSKIFGKHKTISTAAELDAFLRGVLGQSAAGVHVSGETAMRCAPFYSSVRVLSEPIAQLPFILYERKPAGGRERAINHRLFPILHDSPNEYQTAFEFRQELMVNALIYGHGFAYISRNGDGEVLELLPIPNANIKVKFGEKYQIQYTLTEGSEERPVDAGDIFRISGFPGNLRNYTPMEAVSFMRDPVGLAIAAERFGALLFGNGARPGGILSHPQKLSPEAKRNLKDSWNQLFSGAGAHGTAVVDEGMKWEKVSYSAEESQMLQTRKHQRSEIAGALGVPAHRINDLEKATFSNIEHSALEFVIHSVLPHSKRWEQAVHKWLLRPAERQKYFAEFLVDGLLRGDIKARYEAYQIALMYGVMSPNEVRARENLNPRENGDEYYVPANLMSATDPQSSEPQEDAKMKALKDELLSLLQASQNGTGSNGAQAHTV